MTIKVPRFRCKICGKTHSFLPPFLIRFGRWALDSFVQYVRLLTFDKQSLSKVWSLSPLLVLEYKTFCRYISQLLRFAHKASHRLLSWLRRLEPGFHSETVVELYTLDDTSRYYPLGFCVLLIQALNRYRRIQGLKKLSVMGLIHFLGKE